MGPAPSRNKVTEPELPTPWLASDAVPGGAWIHGWTHYAEAMASRDRDDPNERPWEAPDA